MWLDGWKKSCDDVKKMFDVEVSVNWRHNPNEEVMLIEFINR